MKKSIIILAFATIAINVEAQYSTPFYQGVSNGAQSGFIGIGISPTVSPISPLPNFNLHVHGVSDYISPPSTPTGPGGPDPEFLIGTGYTGQGTNNPGSRTTGHGPTSRIGLTNTFTGNDVMDGAVIQMSKNNLYFRNREDGNLTISVPALELRFSSVSKRISVNGNASSTSDKMGRFNVDATLDNGMSIKTIGTDKFGIRVKVKDDNSNIFEGYGDDDNVANFQVTGSGEVYARRYITTLQPFPDYVFQPDYELRTFSELRSFINTNKHLPNMPTALEVEENGADIGEINRLLVEKVEELTLYILELEERVVEVESTDEEENELQERITRLEKLILDLSK
jgi:hypothetical protein